MRQSSSGRVETFFVLPFLRSSVLPPLLQLNWPEPFLNRTFNTAPGSTLEGIFKPNVPTLAAGQCAYPSSGRSERLMRAGDFEYHIQSSEEVACASRGRRRTSESVAQNQRIDLGCREYSDLSLRWR